MTCCPRLLRYLRLYLVAAPLAVTSSLTACANFDSEYEFETLAQATGQAVGSLPGANCMATLVHDRKTVVTAAHCVSGATVFSLWTEENGSEVEKLFPIDSIRVHPDYTRTGGSCFDFDGTAVQCRNDWNHILGVLHNDIAVLTLRDEVDFVAPIPLPLPTQQPEVGDTLFHYGKPDRQGERVSSSVVTVDFGGEGWYAFLAGGDDDGNCFGDSGGSTQETTSVESQDDAPGSPCVRHESTGSFSGIVFSGVHSSGWCNVWGVDIDAATHRDFILNADPPSEEADTEPELPPNGPTPL